MIPVDIRKIFDARPGDAAVFYFCATIYPNEPPQRGWMLVSTQLHNEMEMSFWCRSDEPCGHGGLVAALQICRSALADMGYNTDMDRATMKRKAARIYRETAKAAERGN